MSSDPTPKSHRRLLLVATLGAAALALLACTTTPPGPVLPPSASDLPLLTSAQICDARSSVPGASAPETASRRPWGAGVELRRPATRGEARAQESLFFDEDGLLVGYLLAFPDGLLLEPYPVLRDTLSQLVPTVEFYLDLSRLRAAGEPESSALYMTGDETSTTQYLVQGPVDGGRLLIATRAIDPYYKLLSPYRRDTLARLTETRGGQTERPRSLAGAQDQDPFLSLQEFARGETALLGYCGQKNETVAADAYRKAIESGFSTPQLLAEAHHKLGLAWRAQGDLERARRELEQSLALQPNRPEVLNNLGHVFKETGQRARAIEAYRQAVALRPNYPIARFNLAEAYEAVDVRRAIEEYETYLALAEDLPDETERLQRARQRVEALSTR